MFTLWYIVLGVREYRREGKPVGPGNRAPAAPVPAPTKPDVIPRPSDPIPIGKPQAPTGPVATKMPEPPKPTPPKPARPENSKQSPPAPQPPRQSPPKPSQPRPSPPRATEPVRPKNSPPKTPELFNPQNPQPRPNSQSREDELFAKTLNYGPKSEYNGARIPELSYSDVARREATPKYTERPVVSNPDSLESSETED